MRIAKLNRPVSEVLNRVCNIDEPTSGLDSTNAMKLLEALKNLTALGQSVILTMHQPASRLFVQVDKLLVLSEGHCLYYGEKLIPWEESASLTSRLNVFEIFGQVSLCLR